MDIRSDYANAVKNGKLEQVDPDKVEIGSASNEGVLIKGSNFPEILSQAKYVVFDKTGTMTKGVFEVNGIHHSSGNGVTANVDGMENVCGLSIKILYLRRPLNLPVLYWVLWALPICIWRFLPMWAL